MFNFFTYVIFYQELQRMFHVVVVYHVTIVAIGHWTFGMLKKFWPIVICRVLRTAGSSFI